MIRIGGYAIDAALTQTHDYASEVTSYPVETGVDIVDNVRPLPVRLSMECIVSNTPVGSMRAIREREVADSLEFLPADDAFAKLTGFYEAREPITVETELKVYENMVIESLSIPVSATTGDALVFNISLRQVRFVTNDRTTVRTATPRSKKQKKSGFVPAKTITTLEYEGLRALPGFSGLYAHAARP